MESIKKITLPKGWVIDKIENGEIILKEDNKPIIKWNKEKDGVEVKADGYHFIVASMPTSVTSKWNDAKILCEMLGGYLPSIDELKVMVKYIKEINQCFRDNDRLVCLLDTYCYYWSSSGSEYSSSYARSVYTGDGYVRNDDKAYYYCVRAFLNV